MRTVLYPKTYATYIGRYVIKVMGWYIGKNQWRPDCGYRFRADDGTVIEMEKWPGRSGHTPTRLRRLWHEITWNATKRELAKLEFPPVGTRVKLYQKPGSNRWYYRHIGQ